MPQVRRKNNRNGIYNVGDHHDEIPLKVPAQRKTTEIGCQGENRRKMNIAQNRRSIALAARKVNRYPTTENIEKLEAAKKGLEGAKELLMEHLIECERCAKVPE